MHDLGDLAGGAGEGDDEDSGDDDDDDMPALEGDVKEEGAKKD